MENLLKQFLRIYSVTAKERFFLSAQISSIADRTKKFRFVFQHGDPGTWNILVTPKGHAAFLDWEAAETRGIPLWDLFHLLRSFVVGMARREGERDSLSGLQKIFGARSPASDVFLQAVLRYCDRCHIERGLIEPLFYTCWMHRSLKEANRLTAKRLHQGHYFNLLRWCMGHPNAFLLRRLFAQNPSKPVYSKVEVPT